MTCIVIAIVSFVAGIAAAFGVDRHLRRSMRLDHIGPTDKNWDYRR
jgi:hypothetical protein